MQTSFRQLRYFPVSFFAVSLGLIGFALAVQRAEHILAMPPVSGWLFAFATFVYVATLGTYTLKLFRHFSYVRKEFFHPIKLNFFPIIGKVLLIANIFLFEMHQPTSLVLWSIGAATQLLFSVVILSMWFRHTHFDIKHLNPSWFIPIVGSIIVPITGVQHAGAEVSWFFFSVGLLLWLVLFTITVYRIIFHHPLIDKVIPTLFILFAPPAIGFISYVKLTGTVDAFARILFYSSLFLAMVVFSQVGLFARIRFYLSWWAYSFPTAALVIATLLMYHMTGETFFTVLASGLLAVLVAIMAYLVVRTMQALRHRKLCGEED